MQNFSRLELTDIPFVLSDGELLKVSVFSGHATIAISHKRAAIQISVWKLMATRIQSKLHCHCVTVKGTPRRNFPLPWQNLYPTANKFCVAFINGESAKMSEKLL